MRVISHYLLWTCGLVPPETQTSVIEQACLARWAEGKKVIVEIGVWHGVNSSKLRRVMHPEGTLFAVDPFPKGRLGLSLQERIAHHEVDHIHNGKVRWVRQEGTDAAEAFRNWSSRPVEFIFIDGDHSWEGVRKDWEAWSNLVGEGGIVALHDSRSTPNRRIEGTGSVRYTNEVILKDPKFALVEQADSLTIVQRKDTK